MENLRSILFCLQDRLHTLAIVGTNLLTEDFRLKKAAEQFHVIAASSSIFSKIDQLVQHLLEEGNKEKEISLIEAITLVDAVVCTQAEYIVKKEGKQEIEVLVEGRTKHIEYNELQPVITALTTKKKYPGVVVREFRHNHKEDKEIFRDCRLFCHLIDNLNSKDSLLVSEIKQISIDMGNDVIPLCKKNFDPMGGKDMIHRLEILERLAKDSENDFYISLLENSSLEIKENVIRLLGYSPQNINLLIHLAETKRGRCKTAALTAMEMLNQPETVQYLLTKAKKKPQTYLPYLKNCDTEEVSDAFAEEIEKLVQEIFQIENQSKKDDVSSYRQKINNFYKKSKNILLCIDYKCSNKLINALQKWGGICSYCSLRTLFYQEINKKMIDNMLYRTDKKYINMTKKLYKGCGKVYLECMLIAQFLTEPEKAYDLCLPYFEDKNCTYDIIKIVTSWINYDKDGYYIRNSFSNENGYFSNNRLITKEMDIRWIKLITKLEDISSRFMSWINYNDDKTIPFFRQKLRYILPECMYCTGTGNAIRLYKILQELGETNFSTLVYKLMHMCIKSCFSNDESRYNNFNYDQITQKIFILLNILPFTPQQKIDEIKMILDEVERVGEKEELNENAQKNKFEFKQKLQCMIQETEKQQGKEE